MILVLVSTNPTDITCQFAQHIPHANVLQNDQHVKLPWEYTLVQLIPRETFLINLATFQNTRSLYLHVIGG